MYVCVCVMERERYCELYSVIFGGLQKKKEFEELFDHRVCAYGPGYRVSITGRVIPKTQKMVLDTAIMWLGSKVRWSNPGN